MVFLDFEKPIAELSEQLHKLQEIAKKGQVDVSNLTADLEQRIVEKRREIYGNLSPWQKVQVARHPDRPYSLHFMQHMTGHFVELYGDRQHKDDKAIIGGLGQINGQSVMMIGHQKGINTKMRQYRNFGMANPEGYRKALRLMKLAEKFSIPVITLIDTPGAYPGLEAEQRGQAEAIARNLFEMCRLKVPILCYIIGEGASGGALGIGVGDKVFMLEYTWFSVISPESCSSILWRTWDHKEKAAEALQLTAPDLLRHQLIDGIVPEPIGGAHTDRSAMSEILKAHILLQLPPLVELPAELLVQQRINRCANAGKQVLHYT
jgi:acetyl-CoA carboxylase carboxyl transferase subunit alpha